MNAKERYVPLSERVRQDVLHDNFIPKYSALASAEPSRLILIGVWLIFAPMTIGAVAMGIASVFDTRDFLAATVSVLMHVLFGLITSAVLYTQTRRYLKREID